MTVDDRPDRVDAWADLGGHRHPDDPPRPRRPRHRRRQPRPPARPTFEPLDDDTVAAGRAGLDAARAALAAATNQPTT